MKEDLQALLSGSIRIKEGYDPNLFQPLNEASHGAFITAQMGKGPAEDFVRLTSTMGRAYEVQNRIRAYRMIRSYIDGTAEGIILPPSINLNLIKDRVVLPEVIFPEESLKTNYEVAIVSKIKATPLYIWSSNIESERRRLTDFQEISLENRFLNIKAFLHLVVLLNANGYQFKDPNSGGFFIDNNHLYIVDPAGIESLPQQTKKVYGQNPFEGTNVPVEIKGELYNGTNIFKNVFSCAGGYIETILSGLFPLKPKNLNSSPITYEGLIQLIIEESITRNEKPSYISSIVQSSFESPIIVGLARRLINEINTGKCTIQTLITIIEETERFIQENPTDTNVTSLKEAIFCNLMDQRYRAEAESIV